MGYGVSLDPRYQPGATWARFCDWIAQLRQPRGTYLFDAYRGMTRTQLKTRCRSLAMAYSEYQQIILVLADHGFDALPPEWQEEVRSLQKAYSD